MVDWSKLEENEMRRSVVVNNISPLASEDEVYNAFSISGVIENCEVKSDGVYNKAFIKFAKPASVKSARMISGLKIQGSAVNIEYLFDEYNKNSPELNNPPMSVEGKGLSQEEKPKTSLLIDFLAAGYKLSQEIFRRAKELDLKYGVSYKALEYYQSTIDKYHVKERTASIEEKYKIKEKACYVSESAISLGRHALNTSPGKRVNDLYQSLLQTVETVQKQVKDESYDNNDDTASRHSNLEGSLKVNNIAA